ncbi:hypothetical protein EDI_044210 [Entamoeba dispar SAW760]|uniref:Uncharacterized protein n=1 Tax=Entamoeba dispar (strain ATCC PRA-260 / SAW760) TaxID=370354 RepID=B0EHS1_ENTDS|nr:uncharacterized protein EDI_044210 [Entamoeba dispar SAW760]EDR25865.1 hypothetical protein EDI_044210 [Entamoeba dispar SAW760]|eukprot:EDR25865.1 hypothetical protein EDI_044210 [Entamoeba dispar SAW760]
MNVLIEILLIWYCVAIPSIKLIEKFPYEEEGETKDWETGFVSINNIVKEFNYAVIFDIRTTKEIKINFCNGHESSIYMIESIINETLISTSWNTHNIECNNGGSFYLYKNETLSNETSLFAITSNEEFKYHLVITEENIQNSTCGFPIVLNTTFMNYKSINGNNQIYSFIAKDTQTQIVLNYEGEHFVNGMIKETCENKQEIKSIYQQHTQFNHSFVFESIPSHQYYFIVYEGEGMYRISIDFYVRRFESTCEEPTNGTLLLNEEIIDLNTQKNVWIKFNKQDSTFVLIETLKGNVEYSMYENCQSNSKSFTSNEQELIVNQEGSLIQVHTISEYSLIRFKTYNFSTITTCKEPYLFQLKENMINDGGLFELNYSQFIPTEGDCGESIYINSETKDTGYWIGIDNPLNYEVGVNIKTHGFFETYRMCGMECIDRFKDSSPLILLPHQMNYIRYIPSIIGDEESNSIVVFEIIPISNPFQPKQINTIPYSSEMTVSKIQPLICSNSSKPSSFYTIHSSRRWKIDISTCETSTNMNYDINVKNELNCIDIEQLECDNGKHNQRHTVLMQSGIDYQIEIIGNNNEGDFETGVVFPIFSYARMSVDCSFPDVQYTITNQSFFISTTIYNETLPSPDACHSKEMKGTFIQFISKSDKLNIKGCSPSVIQISIFSECKNGIESVCFAKNESDTECTTVSLSVERDKVYYARFATDNMNNDVDINITFESIGVVEQEKDLELSRIIFLISLICILIIGALFVIVYGGFMFFIQRKKQSKYASLP